VVKRYNVASVSTFCASIWKSEMTSENLEALSLTELTDGFREAAFGLADEIDRPKQYRKSAID
jgi:hypothetical protein